MKMEMPLSRQARIEDIRRSVQFDVVGNRNQRAEDVRFLLSELDNLNASQEQLVDTASQVQRLYHEDLLVSHRDVVTALKLPMWSLREILSSLSATEKSGEAK